MLTEDQIYVGALIRCVVDGEWLGKLARITSLVDNFNLFHLEFLDPRSRQVRMGYLEEYELVET